MLNVTKPLPTVFRVTFVEFTVRVGMVAPPGRLTVRDVGPLIRRFAVPPAKLGDIRTLPVALIVPTPALLVMRPVLRVKVPATVIVLVV